MTTVLKAYYDGTVFVPTIPVDVQTGKMLVMSILQEESSVLHTANQIKILEQITDNLRQINDTEPLPSEFDKIMSQRIHFKDISL
jgi:predicted DNA-binding antitoxin AbrB/MazE fold protein